MILKQLVENREELRIYGDVSLIYNTKEKTLRSEADILRERGQVHDNKQNFTEDYEI